MKRKSHVLLPLKMSNITFPIRGSVAMADHPRHQHAILVLLPPIVPIFCEEDCAGTSKAILDQSSMCIDVKFSYKSWSYSFIIRLNAFL